jgi:hypothetical protein
MILAGEDARAARLREEASNNDDFGRTNSRRRGQVLSRPR